jgi:hypothetical protein
MKLAKVVVPILAFSLFTLPVALSQQVTGSISGSVRDSSGLAVDRSQLRLVNTATGAERVAQTNDSGDFVITSVDPGPYKLSVQAPDSRRSSARASPWAHRSDCRWAT